MKKAYLYINYPNIVVLKTYMDVIKTSLEKNGYSCEYVDSLSNVSKKALIVFPMGTDAYKYYFKGFKNFILWQQGVTSEESYMRHRSFFRKKILNHIDKFAMKKARFIFYVSRELLCYYDKNSAFEKKSYIMPCFNETNVYSDLLKKDYSNPSFAYVGSLDIWQCFDKTVNIFSRIQSLIPEAKLKVLTWDCEKATRLLNESHISNFIVKTVSKEEVSKELMDTSYGFILRENNIVNNVATPTKFSSYLSCGVLPIYSSSLCDFNEHFSSIKEFCNVDDTFDADCIVEYIKTKKDNKTIEHVIHSIFETYYSTTYHSAHASYKMKNFI